MATRLLRPFILTALIVLATATPGRSQASVREFLGSPGPDGTFVIHPGKQIGAVELGTSRTAILQRLGQPTRRTGWPGNWTWQVTGESHLWSGAGAVMAFCGDKLFFAAAYYQGAGSDVDAVISRLRTPEGLSPRSAVAEFGRAYGEAQATVRGVIRAGDLSDRAVALYRNGIAIILPPGSTSSTFGIGVYDVGLCR